MRERHSYVGPLSAFEHYNGPLGHLKAHNMPKMKSNSGAKKRFTVTGSGRLKRKKAFASHILTKKSPKRKRNLRSATLVSPVDEPRMRKLING